MSLGMLCYLLWFSDQNAEPDIILPMCKDGTCKIMATKCKPVEVSILVYRLMSDREPSRWQHNRIYPQPPTDP